MDSNTINFNIMNQGTYRPGTGQGMMDQGSSTKGKSPSNDSTNFIEYQRYQNVATSSTKQSSLKSQHKASIITIKTKPIHKSTKQSKEQQHHKSQFPTFQSRTIHQQESSPQVAIIECLIKQADDDRLMSGDSDILFYKNQLKIQNNTLFQNNKFSLVRGSSSSSAGVAVTTKKPQPAARSHSYVSIFDWMMEIASIMKLTRPVFYRACNIFYQTSKKSPSILQNTNVEKYACCSLLISAKLQKSSMDLQYIDQLYCINKKRFSRQLITTTEISIYQILQWKVPLMNLVSQQVLEVFTKWNSFLEKCEKEGLIRSNSRERFRVGMEYVESQLVKNKQHGEMLYLLDMMVVNQAKKYMHAMSMNNLDQPNKGTKLFYTLIVIAMYSVLTIQNGDTQNKQQYLLPLFKQFYRQSLEMSAIQIDRLQKQIQLSFMFFDFASHLRQIPLNKDWKQVIENDVQTYLPVKVGQKHQLR